MQSIRLNWFWVDRIGQFNAMWKLRGTQANIQLIQWYFQSSQEIQLYEDEKSHIFFIEDANYKP